MTGLSAPTICVSRIIGDVTAKMTVGTGAMNLMAALIPYKLAAGSASVSQAGKPLLVMSDRVKWDPGRCV